MVGAVGLSSGYLSSIRVCGPIRGRSLVPARYSLVAGLYCRAQKIAQCRNLTLGEWRDDLDLPYQRPLSVQAAGKAEQSALLMGSSIEELAPHCPVGVRYEVLIRLRLRVSGIQSRLGVAQETTLAVRFRQTQQQRGVGRLEVTGLL